MSNFVQGVKVCDSLEICKIGVDNKLNKNIWTQYHTLPKDMLVKIWYYYIGIGEDERCNILLIAKRR